MCCVVTLVLFVVCRTSLQDHGASIREKGPKDKSGAISALYNETINKELERKKGDEYKRRMEEAHKVSSRKSTVSSVCVLINRSSNTTLSTAGRNSTPPQTSKG